MKNVYSIIILAGLYLTTLAAPALAGPADFGIRPRVETGLLLYQLQEDDYNYIANTATDYEENRIQGIDISSTMITLGTGVTVFVSRFFADLSLQKALNGDDSFSRDQYYYYENNTLGFEEYQGDGDGTADFDRLETSLSLGYAITNNLAVFIGYKRAETDFTMRIDYDVRESINSFVETYSVINRLNVTHTYKGPFTGASYAWPVNRGLLRGSLAANIALAFLSGDLDATENWSDDYGSQYQPNPLTFSGDTLGFTLGAKWTGTTGLDRLTYSVGMHYYRYNFEADNSDQSDITETALSIRGGLGYSF